MNRNAPVLLLLPFTALMMAPGDCAGTEGTGANPCAPDVTLSVEAGGDARAIPNVCVPAGSVDTWDPGSWDVRVELPREFEFAEAGGRILLTAPESMMLRRYEGKLSVVQRRCKVDPATDCLRTVNVYVDVVAKGTLPAFSVAIGVESGGQSLADFKVPVGQRARLTATVSGIDPAGVTYGWRALDLVGGGRDTSADGAAAPFVDTREFAGEQTYYEVTATSGALSARTYVVLAGDFGGGVKMPVSPINEYAGSELELEVQIPNPLVLQSGGEFVFERAVGSGEFSAAEQDALLSNPAEQAAVAWEQLVTAPASTQANKVTFSPGANMQTTVGVLRIVLRGVVTTGSRDVPTRLAYTFARRY